MKQVVHHQPMCGDWHGLAKMAAKRHTHEQRDARLLDAPLSLVDNINTSFINNTRYFKTRFYNVIKIHKVQFNRCFRGRHCRMSYCGHGAVHHAQNYRSIVDDSPHRPTPSLPPSPSDTILLLPLLHICSSSPSSSPPRQPVFGCCVFVSSAAVRGLNVIIFVFLHFFCISNEAATPSPSRFSPNQKSYI